MENQNQGNMPPAQPDELHVGLKILSFCIPLAGAIIYFTSDANQFPNKRKQACYAALFGIGAVILFYIIVFVIAGVAASTAQ